MQLPKSPKKPKIREKKCVYPGCGEIFYGIHAAKYCSVHRDPKTRVKEKPVVEHVTEKNQVLEHVYDRVKTVVMNCALEGCNAPFEVKVYPRQFVYPKYCPEHRNEHKRNKHVEVHSKK
jgi:hypothetical protein